MYGVCGSWSAWKLVRRMIAAPLASLRIVTVTRYGENSAGQAGFCARKPRKDCGSAMRARNSTSPCSAVASRGFEVSGRAKDVVGDHEVVGGVWNVSALTTGPALSMYGSSFPRLWSGLTQTRAPRYRCHSDTCTCQTPRHDHPICCPARTRCPWATIGETCQ